MSSRFTARVTGGELHLAGTPGAALAVRPSCGGTIDDLILVPMPPDGRVDPGTVEAAVSVLAGDPAPARGDCDPGLFRGRFLVPWNDRIPGGRYTFDGHEHHLATNEGNDAIHGFLYRMPLTIRSIDEGADAATAVLGADIAPDAAAGYPWALDVALELRLSAGALTVGMSVANTGTRAAPVTMGWHPYFRLPGSRADDLVLTLDSQSIVPVDEDLMPRSGPVAIEEDALDFRRPAPVGSAALDVAYHTPGGRTARIANGELELQLSQDASFAFTQVFIPPDRRSVAIEPVTAATNAFSLPELGLTRLEPGSTLHGAFTVSLHRLAAPGSC
jgi:aldose 1-epimerase